MKRGELWWADLGPYRIREQTGRRPVVVWQSDTLTQVLQSVLVIPLTTNTQRANLAGTALIAASPDESIRVYRLSDEQFQLNAPVMDQVHGYVINGYVFRWTAPCPQPE